MLILPIKRKWFNMILSGEKKEEYREIKKYYRTRLARAMKIHPVLIETCIDKESPEFKVKFNNGYFRNCPSFIADCTLSIGQGKEEWGAEVGRFYYVLHIKKIRWKSMDNLGGYVNENNKE